MASPSGSVEAAQSKRTFLTRTLSLPSMGAVRDGIEGAWLGYVFVLSALETQLTWESQIMMCSVSAVYGVPVHVYVRRSSEEMCLGWA